MTVRPGSFTPPPKVMSVVLRFTPAAQALAPSDRLDFLAFLKGCFAQRRKKLRNVASEAFAGAGALPLDELARRTGIDFNARAEDLALHEWFKLYEAVRRPADGGGAR